jgi:hypothetical protein
MFFLSTFFIKRVISLTFYGTNYFWNSYWSSSEILSPKQNSNKVKWILNLNSSNSNNELAQLFMINMVLKWHKMFICNLILMFIIEAFLHSCFVFWSFTVSALVEWKCIWTILVICCPWLIFFKRVISMPCWKWELKTLCYSF